MGAYSPVPLMTPALRDHVMRDVMEPVVHGLARQGVRYTGVLYAGLMVHEGRAKVLEFNVRFGDPEAQVLMVRLASDLAELMDAACEGTPGGRDRRVGPACGGLRRARRGGLSGRGREGPRRSRGSTACATGRDGVVFHAGTRRDGDRVVTDGGRVLGVTALGADVAGARRRGVRRRRSDRLARHALPPRHRPARARGAGEPRR